MHIEHSSVHYGFDPEYSLRDVSGQRSEVSPPDAVLTLSKGTNFKYICGSGDISCSWDWDKETFYSISRPLVTIMHFTHPTLLNKQKFQCDSKTFSKNLIHILKCAFAYSEVLIIIICG